MNNINTLERRLKDAQRIKKYLIRNNASKTKISEIKRIENFLDVELNKEKMRNKKYFFKDYVLLFMD